MLDIQYLIGDATNPKVSGVKFLPHICNDRGGWGAGYVLALSKRWPEPEKHYRLWHKEKCNGTAGDDLFQLGACQFVHLPDDICVVNMIAQEGYGEDGKPPVRYEALDICLQYVAQQAAMFNASIHMPRIGCGLAGGKWEKVEAIIKERLCANDIPVYVYDLR